MEMLLPVKRNIQPCVQFFLTEGLRIDNWDELTGEWTDGTMGGGFNGQWDINRPLEGLGDCVALSSCDGRFTNIPCSEALPAVCQMTACQTGESATKAFSH